MKTDQIMYCVIALLLGMLLANMLKDVCGCNVVEGNKKGDKVTFGRGSVITGVVIDQQQGRGRGRGRGGGGDNFKLGKHSTATNSKIDVDGHGFDTIVAGRNTKMRDLTVDT